MIPALILLILCNALTLCTAQNKWIFGYGSLISKSSRDSTYTTNMPWRSVRVFGIARGWWAPGTVAEGWASIIGQEEQTAPTFLGAYFDNTSTTNGVIFQVNDTALAAFDVRELSGAGYNRIPIPITSIFPTDGAGPVPAGDTVYFYNVIQSLLSTPTEKAPIVTSYVDIIMTACLEIDAAINPGMYNFTSDFVKLTQNWSPYWVNDRVVPRRPWVYQPKAKTIDTILAQNIDPKLLLGISYDLPDLLDYKVANNDRVARLETLIANLTKQLEDVKKNGGALEKGFGLLGVILTILLGHWQFMVFVACSCNE